MAETIASRASWRWRLLYAVAATLTGAAVVSPPASAATVDVSVAGLAFSPASVTVAMTGGEPGAEALHGHVTWTVADPGQQHTITFDDRRLVSSGRLADGQRHEAVISSAGTYAYRCTIHPAMTGTVVVAAPAAAPTPTSVAAATPAPGGAGLTAESRSTGVVPVALGVAVLAAAAALAGVLLRRRRPATTPEPPD